MKRIKEIKLLQIKLDYLHFNNENYAYFLDDKGIAQMQNKLNEIIKTLNLLSKAIKK